MSVQYIQPQTTITPFDFTANPRSQDLPKFSWIDWTNAFGMESRQTASALPQNQLTQMDVYAKTIIDNLSRINKVNGQIANYTAMMSTNPAAKTVYQSIINSFQSIVTSAEASNNQTLDAMWSLADTLRKQEIKFILLPRYAGTRFGLLGMTDTLNTQLNTPMKPRPASVAVIRGNADRVSTIVPIIPKPPASVAGKYIGYTSTGQAGGYDWRIENTGWWFRNPNEITVYDALNPTNKKIGGYYNGTITAFGINGTVDPDGTIRWSNSTYWKPVKTEGFGTLTSAVDFASWLVSVIICLMIIFAVIRFFLGRPIM